MPLPESLATSPERAGWLVTVTDHLIRREPRSRVLSGSIVMLLSAALVSAINFGYTVTMARMLGPAGFGHVSAAMTILMLVSAITLAFQLVCAKFVARNERAGARVSVYYSLLGKAWIVSLLVGVGLFVAQKIVAGYLHLPDPWILGVLAIGISVYVPLGVRRGAMQGVCSFGRMSSNAIIESLAKLMTAILLVAVGYGVLGAVGAISASVIVAYLIPRLPKEFDAKREWAQPASFREGAQAIVFFVGQVIINNIDILLVKHFFAPEQAGLYAAVALVGRVLYFAAWSVVSAMFPVSAAAKPREEDPNVILVPLLFVLGIGVVFVLVLSFFPGLVVQTIFGGSFAHAEPLLALYAVATGLYALSVVLIAYEMSRRIANTGWLQLVFSGVLILAIGAFHETLQDVIMVQIVLMAMMLLFVSFPFYRRYKLLLGREVT
ncbi:MAG TPA: oligosaccharide flippase family protein [Candidatus Angelobacter sp.]|jgi:O-antigen/teichoic acid export membrane protein|nr:oligosaccharide flippase family protein [Candidatus Angelobacter sp.]